MNHKMDINEELNRIIYKYNLDKHYPAYRMSRRACSYMHDLTANLSGGKGAFLFISMDKRALNLIRGWAKNDSVSILFIDAVGELEKHLEELKGAKQIYIVSFNRTNEMFHWLWRHDFSAESVYDMMERDNIYLQMEFYRFFTPLVMAPELELDGERESPSCDGSSLTLYEYYYQKQRLIHGCCDEDNNRILEKLFFLDLQMGNFIDAEKILNEIKDRDDLKESWVEVQRLLAAIKEKLNNRTLNDIIFYWLDALQYNKAFDMEYLQSRRVHSFYFHNAYTVTPYTNPTLRNIFCGVTAVDDLGYAIDRIGLDNSLLLRDIRERGYQFNKKACINFDGQFDASYGDDTYVTQSCVVCSEAFWNMIGQILRNDKKTVYFVYLGSDVHVPGISVRRERFEKKYFMDYADVQRQELDAQLRFYDGMLGDSPYRIYMSDHGLETDVRERTHVHFQVYHSSWIGKETYKLYCHLDFGKILHRIMLGRPVDESAWDREFVPIQDLPYYNGLRLNTYVRGKNIFMQWLGGYKGVISKDAVYIRFMNGEEIFHKWSDAMLSNPFFGDNLQRDDKLFEELSDRVGAFPGELDTDPKFKYIKYIHRVSDNINITVHAVAKLINQKFDTYPDGSIVLRNGGVHSLQLYTILTRNNRRKIGGIIDSKDNCICKDLGCPIYKVGEELPPNINSILLSSYRYLGELITEAERIYKNYEIIDIYELLEQSGYCFAREFYFGLDSDWDVGFPFD